MCEWGLLFEMTQFSLGSLIKQYRGMIFLSAVSSIMLSVLALAMPLVLGSWLSFAVMLSYPLAIVQRIKNEEQLLSEGLPGYKEYLEKVKYRLIPYVW